MRYKLLFCFSFIVLSLSAVAQEIKISHGPYIQAVGSTETTIVWTTDTDAVSWVEVAPAGNNSFYNSEHPRYYQTKNGNRVIGQLHKIVIKGLAPGTEYRYRIFSQAVLEYAGHRVLYGNIASTNVYRQRPLRFKTLDSAKESISFTVLNDIHGRNDDLSALSRDVEFGKTDFVIFNGDMVSSMDSEQQFFEGFMDESVKLFASEVPVFFSRGNHETRGPFSVNFPDYFPTYTEKLYYSFRQGPVYFIFLDCGEDKPDSDIEYSGLAQFDAYRTEQQEWLKIQTETEIFKTAPHKVVIIHIPPVGSDWHGPLDIKRKILPVLKNKGISAMICGHIHNYKYIEPDNEIHDFPIIINAHNTSLDIQVDMEKMVILRKDTAGRVINKIELD
jgi:Icc-related predicted phosphoesterase